MKRMILLLGLALIPSLCFGAYKAEEMCVIGWGDSANQLKIDMPFHEDVNNTPDDNSDDWIEYAGPKMGVLDKDENIYLASHFYMQLKGFDKSGHLIFDCSEDAPSYNPAVYKSDIRNIYVDSLSRIFVIDGVRYDYIAIIDTNCNVIGKISPHGVGSGIVVRGFSAAYDDILLISCKDGTNYTYSEGKMIEGAGFGQLARDGYYYRTELIDSTQIHFQKYHNADIRGVGTDLQEAYIPLINMKPYYSKFIGIDDSSILYVYLVGPDIVDNRIQMYDTSFNYIGELDFPKRHNKYEWYMYPYMRPSDGNIYEFRCLDDGLHVVRWKRE
jgi:hypothetical protein